MVSTIDFHLKSPELSIDRYTKQRQIELGRQLDGRIGVYLDQKFWIMLRKAHAGHASPVAEKLLALMRDLVGDGAVFCPISETVFLELMKQEDVNSRIRTAELIDELSLGVALAPFDVRAGTELAHFTHSFLTKPSSLVPLRHLVWTKLSYVLGFIHPSHTAFDAATELAIQKAFVDELWPMTLATMMKTIGGADIPSDLSVEKWAASTNRNSAKHAAELGSFAQAYETELRGSLELLDGIVMEIARDLATKTGEPFPPYLSRDWMEQKKMWLNLLFRVLKEDVHRRRLPSIHVVARIHAAYRWDKKRQFEANDLYDIFHASAALGFCGAFFTERGLRKTISDNHVGLDRLYGCSVMASPAEAVTFLEGLARKANELADRAASVSHIENARGNPTLDKLDSPAGALEVSSLDRSNRGGGA